MKFHFCQNGGNEITPRKEFHFGLFHATLQTATLQKVDQTPN